MSLESIVQPIMNKVSTAQTALSGVLPQEPFKVLKGFGQHLQAFHSYSNDLSRHVSATHICCHLTPTLHQCLIFDGDGNESGGIEGRRLIGIEYLVKEEVFKTLPEEEKKYWHSHKTEVECGLLQLVGLKSVPGPVTPAIEQGVMTELHTTYGKTIHTWQYDKHPDLPLGPPQLMMSYTDDSQIPKELVDKRDEKYGVSTADKKATRAEFLDLDYERDELADQSNRTGKGIEFVPTPVDNQGDAHTGRLAGKGSVNEGSVREEGGLKFVSNA